MYGKAGHIALMLLLTHMCNVTSGQSTSPNADKSRASVVVQSPTTARTVSSEAGKPQPGSADASIDAAGIFDALASATEALVGEGGFDDLLERFVDADRDRIGESADEQHMDDLDTRAESIMTAWAKKYGHDFELADERAVFKGIRIEPHRAGQTSATGAAARSPSTTPPTTLSDAAMQARGKQHDQSGGDAANVTFPAAFGVPELTIKMVRTSDGWRFDVPDTLGGQAMKQNMLTQLNVLHQRQPQWPTDANEAYRMVTHRMLMAIHDKPAW